MERRNDGTPPPIKDVIFKIFARMKDKYFRNLDRR